MKNCVCIFLLLISASCSTGLKQRDIRECRENAFQNQTLPMAVIEVQYNDCISEKREMQAAERQMTLIENVFEVMLDIFDVKEPD
ncbi:hypothetical protein AN214_01344 [Pseudoalteromonas sp. P1-9]|uniref:hypothetical protein n=1 Tax=Pseudoalteromonas sp. P1-9 TaxID=1710354 RepID=UPI0006D5F612|nr:hypothetical protein [Pseudoalteromonas sp. P1-9]KPV96883.1 hypothetical protein AN214_01344 [Pseudoalteromonas sp. P1-9]